MPGRVSTRVFRTLGHSNVEVGTLSANEYPNSPLATNPPRASEGSASGSGWSRPYCVRSPRQGLRRYLCV